MPPGKKPAEGGNDRKATELIVSLLVGLFIIAALVAGLLNYIESFGLGTPEVLWSRIINYFLQHIWPIWKPVSAIVSVLAILGIIYNSWKIRAINIEEQKIYDPRPENTVVNEAKVTEPKNEKWEKVMKYLNSDSPSDWRLAIIEADVMLEEMLRLSGYIGESVGEMLKSVDKNEFLTIEDAWDAHKVRNTIAHSGGDFQLNERETRRVIALFEKVFKEFQAI